MCLVALALDQDRRFPLVVAANRDEYFNRPAARLAWWTPTLCLGHSLVPSAGISSHGITASLAAARMRSLEALWVPSSPNLVPVL